MSKQHVTMIVMLDLSLEFDTVDLKILFHIYRQKFNIQCGVYHWTKSYLEDRCQRISIHNLLSRSYELQYGVPQGRCVGSVIFLIYIILMLLVTICHQYRVMLMTIRFTCRLFRMI